MLTAKVHEYGRVQLSKITCATMVYLMIQATKVIAVTCTLYPLYTEPSILSKYNSSKQDASTNQTTLYIILIWISDYTRHILYLCKHLRMSCKLHVDHINSNTLCCQTPLCITEVRKPSWIYLSCYQCQASGLNSTSWLSNLISIVL